MPDPRDPKAIIPATAKATLGEREITIPGRKAPPRVRFASPGELRMVRLLVAISAASSLVFGLIAFIGFQLILFTLRCEPPSTAECLDDVDCGDGQLCQNRRCRASPSESICEVNDPCGADECSCEPPMACTAGICVDPTPAAPAACDDPELQKVLARLQKECKGDLGTCKPGSLDKFAMKDKSFDTLISAFPDVITLHFDAGKPPLDDNAWPDARTRAYYVQRLARSRDVLLAAKHIFIIARSSPHGNTRRNGLYAQKRSIHTKEMLFAALDLGVADRDAFSAKFLDFVLGPRRKIDRGFFAQRYSNHFITWSKSSHNLLLKLIKSDEVLSEHDEQWADDTINQVVLIVPILCELKPSAGE